jgi:hypothetical protein
MEPAELAELDLMLPAMLASDAIRENGTAMSPADLRKMTLLATGDEFLADQAWSRAIHRKMEQQDGKAWQ